MPISCACLQWVRIVDENEFLAWHDFLVCLKIQINTVLLTVPQLIMEILRATFFHKNFETMFIDSLLFLTLFKKYIFLDR